LWGMCLVCVCECGHLSGCRQTAFLYIMWSASSHANLVHRHTAPSPTRGWRPGTRVFLTRWGGWVGGWGGLQTALLLTHTHTHTAGEPNAPCEHPEVRTRLSFRWVGLCWSMSVSCQLVCWEKEACRHWAVVGHCLLGGCTPRRLTTSRRGWSTFIGGSLGASGCGVGRDVPAVLLGQLGIAPSHPWVVCVTHGFSGRSGIASSS
jgi:hypothetical protein